MTDPTHLVIGTYNVYFDELHFITRFRYIIEKLLVDCQIICLQEIPEPHLKACEEILISNQFIYIVYSSCRGTRPPSDVTDIAWSYGILTASKLAPLVSQEIRFKQTLMGRSFLDFVIKLNNHPVHILNTHLESLYQFQSLRESQMKQMIEYSAGTPDSTGSASSETTQLDYSILLGDFNTVYKKLYFDNFLNPQVDQPTWFGKRFNMGTRSCRFDRIYTGKQIESIGPVRAIGDHPIPEIGHYPSDHNGIIIKITTK